MDKYEFLLEKQNKGRCINCPWKSEEGCDNNICLVEAHQTNNQIPFTPYNGVTPFNKME